MEEARQEVERGRTGAVARGFTAFALFCVCLCAPNVLFCAGHEEPQLEASGFVELIRLEPDIVLDMRYATSNNFTGKAVYPSGRCFLLTDIAKRLVAVHKALKADGYGLKVYDCYRPFSVQQRFWAIMPDERYVLEPRRENGVIVKSSRHNRGAAVDVTLVDAQGRELPMPTGFDDFSEKAHRGSLAASPEARRNSDILERAMTEQGFEPLSTEWWHFDGPGWQTAPPLDLPLPQN
ncbi:D-alanyl-D-alanine dipeptidase [Humidesulfovibrio mexicanus]|uniref:D-alanyl-D-alanine dipeptidase n=1 Tax=Humidesulfovibrio mexicanus TaxID=147047 RepID=A0A238XQJ6_9BACT|nr:M15 family metallopeptidase [Humidesulfovibrio mexicanus]SNR61245.1 D-alanyl-D-alanine dipeptidase [Humidesulfovibrio mexicanus]